MLLCTEELVHILLKHCRLKEREHIQIATIESAELQELQQTLTRLTTEEQNATYGNRRLQISRNNTENEDCKHRLCLTETQQIKCKHFLDTYSIDMETFQRINKQLVVLLHIIGQYIEIFQDEEVSLKELLFLSKTYAITLSRKQSFPDLKTKLDNKWDDFTKHVRDLEADGP
ncbi:uncharacterized protein LOC127858577 [Dreissena polymorpha]|nr:uncharacterized protein LOC127858577 [Dreissena polymorpha]